MELCCNRAALRVLRGVRKNKYQNNSETVQGTVAHYQFTTFKLINAWWWRPTRALWKANSDLVKKLIFPPRKWLHDASFDCMLSKCLTEIISAIPRVTLSFSPGQLCLGSDFVHVKVSSGRILRGKKFLCSIQILNHSSRRFPHPQKGKLVSFLHNYEWTEQEKISIDTLSLLKPLLPFQCSLAELLKEKGYLPLEVIRHSWKAPKRMALFYRTEISHPLAFSHRSQLYFCSGKAFAVVTVYQWLILLSLFLFFFFI